MKINFLKYKKFFFIPVFTILLILWIIDYEKNLRSNFSGVVEHVNYDVKGEPTVTIKGEDYYLNYNGWDRAIPIEVGDKLIKKKGDFHLLLIKLKSKDTIELLQ